ncbi:hypothetical protein [Pedobacter sp. NJ-S-72]
MPTPKFPVIYTIEAFGKTSPAPSYISFYQKTIVKEFIAIGLRSGDVIFGGLYIFSYSNELSIQKNEEIIQVIAAQLSIAIANMIANEKIIKKEKENAVLLSLSNAIATIRNKTDLFNVIEEKLKKIFRFEHFVICLINDDKKTHSPFLYNQTESFFQK